MTAGNDDGPAVTGFDVGQGHQHVDLATHKAATVVAKLVAVDRRVTTGVESDPLAGQAEVGEALVDEERPVVIVEAALAADVQLHVVYPGPVVDQPLEGLAGFIDLLIVQAVPAIVAVAVYMPVPLSRIEARNGWTALSAPSMFT